jgi:DNA invertase Pin-like site-specific DNA recombinase
MTPAAPKIGAQLGYARVSTGRQSPDQQLDALTAAGVDPERVYRDKLSGTSTREQRPGLAALLDYARPGDAIVVVGIDRLGRNAAEVMTTIRELRYRGIVLRSLLRRTPALTTRSSAVAQGAGHRPTLTRRSAPGAFGGHGRRPSRRPSRAS